MFTFFSKLRTEVTAAVSSLHERVVTLETKVDALFSHAKETVTAAPVKAVEAVAAVPEKAVEAVASDAVAKVEAVATEVESKV